MIDLQPDLPSMSPNTAGNNPFKVPTGVVLCSSVPCYTTPYHRYQHVGTYLYSRRIVTGRLERPTGHSFPSFSYPLLTIEARISGDLLFMKPDAICRGFPQAARPMTTLV